MGLMDAFKEEDRVDIKVSSMETLMKNAAKAELIFNGIKANVPYRYLREVITGNEEVEENGELPAVETEGEDE